MINISQTGTEQFKDACILLDTYYEIKNRLTGNSSTSPTEDVSTKKVLELYNHFKLNYNIKFGKFKLHHYFETFTTHY